MARQSKGKPTTGIQIRRKGKVAPPAPPAAPVEAPAETPSEVTREDGVVELPNPTPKKKPAAKKGAKKGAKKDKHGSRAKYTNKRQKAQREARKRRGPRKHKPKVDPVTEQPLPGRPPLALTDEEKEEIRAMYGIGLTDDHVQIVKGIARSTFYDHRDMFEALKTEGLALSLMDVSNSLFTFAKGGSLGHMRMYLQKVHGWTERQVVQSEMSGPNGGPIVSESRTLASDEEIMAKLRTLVSRAATMHATHSVAADLPMPGRQDEIPPVPSATPAPDPAHDLTIEPPPSEDPASAPTTLPV